MDGTKYLSKLDDLYAKNSDLQDMGHSDNLLSPAYLDKSGMFSEETSRYAINKTTAMRTEVNRMKAQQ